jgi:cysteinyl-tRNA synthetase
MPISIYNTLTRKKELFQTIEPKKVRMYVCGPTVYDSCHIGHARSVVVFDVIFRYLKTQGYDVVYVRNFTDIDDKIIRRAAETGLDPKVLADKYIDEFYRDMDALHVERASFEPRVTEHIDDVIELVEKLLAKQVAYVVDGDVFFAVDAFDAYGKLSHRHLEDMDAGARVEIDPRKRNPFDFILWKSAKTGEPSWDSPWGKGRPGWHIECSAMSARYLGKTFDIHGGGRDLIFPHHENEIAQSEAGHDREFVRYWIHNGFVNIDKEKMSKSLGNFRMIKDVIQQYHPEAVRLFLLSNQYRKPIDFSQASMEASRTALDRIYALLLRIDETVAGEKTPAMAPGDMPFWKIFCQAMDDDFNTANGIAVIFNAVRHANRIMDENETSTNSRDVRVSLSAIKLEILRMGAVLGIGSDAPEVYFRAQRELVLAQETIDAGFIEKLIADRETARQEKDWKRADQIREQLTSMNIVLKDRPDGTYWEIKS